MHEIREKAVRCLEGETIETLKLIMLQLVQTYRYEKFEESQLKKLFFSRVFEDFKLTNSFHWLVHLDKENNENEQEIQEKY